jgi:hypothetical protein
VANVRKSKAKAGSRSPSKRSRGKNSKKNAEDDGRAAEKRQGIKGLPPWLLVNQILDQAPEVGEDSSEDELAIIPYY